MGTEATAVLIDGKIELPEDTLKARRWSNGSLVEIVPTEDGILLRDAHPARVWNASISFEEMLAANKKRLGLAPDAEDWRALEGILADDFLDSLEEKHRLRDEELAHDRRLRFSPKHC